jgi:hypothetical protein
VTHGRNRGLIQRPLALSAPHPATRADTADLDSLRWGPFGVSIRETFAGMADVLTNLDGLELLKSTQEELKVLAPCPDNPLSTHIPRVLTSFAILLKLWPPWLGKPVQHHPRPIKNLRSVSD